jgi:diguanylate cyclase (GGDEF)-like protein/PAS domain S-box-containing protein
MENHSNKFESIDLIPEQIQQQKLALNAIFQVLPDLFFLMDPDGTILAHQCQSSSDLYLPPESFLGKKMQDVLPSDTAKQFDKHLSSIKNNSDFVTFDYQLEMPKGLRHFEARLMQIPDSIHIIAVVRDITERKLTEKSLSEKSKELDLLNKQLQTANKSLVDAQQKITESEDNYSKLFNLSRDGYVIAKVGGEIINANPAYIDMLGYTEEDIYDVSWHRFTPTHWLEWELKTQAEKLIERGFTDLYEKEYIRKDGTVFPVQLQAFLLNKPEKTEDAITAAFVRDISDKKQAENELQKLSRAVDSSSSGVIITDHLGNIEYVNPKFTDITGYEKADVIGKNASILQSGENPDSLYDELWQTITSGKEWKGEFHNLKKDGSHYWARNSISGVKDIDGGEVSHFICIQDDVTHEYELTEKLSYQASHDVLTGLINRHEFERRIERLLATLKQEPGIHALCFMDLDQFKVVNDTCGHAAGDELLRQLSTLLQNTVRHRDTLARLGGDEFGILMEHCSLDDAHRVANSILQAVQDFQFSWDDYSFKLGVSIGLVSIADTSPNLTELLKHADAACYVAKDNGRNRIHVHDIDDSEIAQRHGEMQWVTRINKALQENRFCLYAQVIVPLSDNNAKHYEFLIRMIDEQGKTIPPGAFLPSAERYNLITKLDYWVIEAVFELLENNPEFLKQVDFCSINLSGQSLTDMSFQDHVVEKFTRTSIPPGKICFEITETAAITNLSTASLFIAKMKVLGCQFALDDFGSGLSSFGYLKNLTVDYLKIDGMFVKNIVDDPIDRAMVKSINEIGQVMGMKTIAEFVENDAIQDILLDIGVNFAQGYGLGKPIPSQELLLLK